MNIKLIRNKLLVTVLLVMLISTPIITVGCQEESTQPLVTSTYNELSLTLVPNVNLDVYVYAKQENPTIVPKDVIGTPYDVIAESLSLWGIPTEDAFIFGGELTLASSADATKIHAQIRSQAGTWTKLSDRTIYFVQDSGAVAETLRAAISQNDFKYYDDQRALLEVALLPNDGTTKLAAVGIVKPSETLAKLIAKTAAPEASGMIDTLLTWARLQVITVGLYAPQQIDIADIAQIIELGTIQESDFGILASIKSELPGFVVSPIVKIILGNTGYAKTNLGELNLYKGSFNTDNGKTIPILVRIEGNRIFASASGQKSYAEKLITSVSK